MMAFFSHFAEVIKLMGEIFYVFKFFAMWYSYERRPPEWVVDTPRCFPHITLFLVQMTLLHHVLEPPT